MNSIRFFSIGMILGLLLATLMAFWHRKTIDPSQDVLKAQHRADSAQALLSQWKQQHRIDSLTILLLHRNALDSMRAHAGLSDLDAMRKINGAIQKR